MTPLYALFDRNVRAMTLHILAGSTVLGLGFSQFLPGLRRRVPRLHRTLGGIVIVAMLLCIAGAMIRLGAEPPDATYSGPAFHGSLWFLALASLVTTTQAIFALVRRDYRQHMVWMAMAWSVFLTAPSLRVSVTALYRVYGGVHEHLNISAAAGAWVLTSLLMLLWLQFVGDSDLPARPSAATRWPRPLLTAKAAVTVLFSLHEGVLAP